MIRESKDTKSWYAIPTEIYDPSEKCQDNANLRGKSCGLGELVCVGGLAIGCSIIHMETETTAEKISHVVASATFGALTGAGIGAAFGVFGGGIGAGPGAGVGALVGFSASLIKIVIEEIRK